MPTPEDPHEPRNGAPPLTWRDYFTQLRLANKAVALFICLCSLAVAVLSASALCLFVPDYELATEDECECCDKAKPDAGAES